MNKPAGSISAPWNIMEAAFHEAGHAVVGHLVGIEASGGAELLADGGITRHRPLKPEDGLAAVVLYTLAGYAAFNHAFPAEAREFSDGELLAVLSDVRSTLADEGRRDFIDAADEFHALVWIAACNPSATDASLIEIYRDGEREAARLMTLPKIWGPIEAVMTGLIDRSFLSGPELSEIIVRNQPSFCIP